MYVEQASAIDGATVWSRSGGGAARILPDGCMDLIWAGGRLMIAGPDTRAHLSANDASGGFVGLRFAPGTGPAVFGVPAAELVNQRVPLDAVWAGADVRRATEAVATAASPATALETIAAHRLAVAAPLPPTTAVVVDGARAGRTVAEMAETAGISTRQLQRLSLDAFGYGAKTLTRVLRLNRALDLARAGVDLAAVAAQCGYADQAHFARDARDLAGATVRELTHSR